MAQPSVLQAIKAGNEMVVIRLLETGADPNARDAYGPALTQAIRKGQESVANRLLETGAHKPREGIGLRRAF